MLLLLLLSCFSCVRFCVIPQTAAHQAPLSLGFSRQEYWGGLPFLSPMHVRMLSCFSRVRLCVTLGTVAHQAPVSTGVSRQEYWSGLTFPSPLKMLISANWKTCQYRTVRGMPDGVRLPKDLFIYASVLPTE